MVTPQAEPFDEGGLNPAGEAVAAESQAIVFRFTKKDPSSCTWVSCRARITRGGRLRKCWPARVIQFLTVVSES